MNDSQKTNLITTVMQSLMGMLVGRGLITGSEAESISGAIIALVVFLISHNWHSDKSGGPPMGIPKLPAIFLACALALGLVSGCANTPSGVAYKSEASADTVATAAMRAWGDYVAQNHPPASQEMAVKSAFEKFQAAEIVVIDASAEYVSVAQTNSVAAGARLDRATQGAGRALGDLLNVLRQFGVKV